MQRLASCVRELDPRLKLAVALVLGPCLWKVTLLAAVMSACLLFILLVSLALSQPVGWKMIRSLFVFVVFWVGIKVVLDSLSGVPLPHLALDAFNVFIRLLALLVLGLTLSLSTSARALGLAVAWCVRPLVGKERAWRLALSLSLMIHFLPLCLSTMATVKETIVRRCPGYGFRHRMLIIPQAVIRNLGQKTWNQTLAIAGRGFDRAEAWAPEFAWTGRDWLCSALAGCFFSLILFV